MTTKQKILTTALLLFNKEGIEEVTVRDIAKAMGISHGNLCYHYPSREVIIETLYNQLVEELNKELEKVQQDSVSLQLVYDVLVTTYKTLYKYKFLMIDFVAIMRKIPGIKKHFRGLMKQREIQFSLMLDNLQKQGVLKEEVIPGQYKNLIRQQMILGDFWIANSEIINDIKEDEKIKYYTEVSLSSILFALTKKGLNQYKKIMII